MTRLRLQGSCLQKHLVRCVGNAELVGMIVEGSLTDLSTSVMRHSTQFYALAVHFLTFDGCGEGDRGRGADEGC